VKQLGQVSLDSNKMLMISLTIIATVFYWVVLYSPVLIISAQTDDKNANLTIGQINSTQKDLNSNTTWLLSGKWKSNLFTNTDFNNTNPGKFSATINMLMANGSSGHKHKISDFSLTNMSKQQNGTTVYEGTMSVSMKDGPIFGIPYVIKNLHNRMISLSLEGITSDQLEVVNHFGRTPIIGIFPN
jgi:predicted secreted protein